jgi:hypothetical protein
LEFAFFEYIFALLNPTSVAKLLKMVNEVKHKIEERSIIIWKSRYEMSEAFPLLTDDILNYVKRLIRYMTMLYAETRKDASYDVTFEEREREDMV